MVAADESTVEARHVRRRKPFLPHIMTIEEQTAELHHVFRYHMMGAAE